MVVPRGIGPLLSRQVSKSGILTWEGPVADDSSCTCIDRHNQSSVYCRFNSTQEQHQVFTQATTKVMTTTSTKKSYSYHPDRHCHTLADFRSLVILPCSYLYCTLYSYIRTLYQQKLRNVKIVIGCRDNRSAKSKETR